MKPGEVIETELVAVALPGEKVYLNGRVEK